MRGLVPKVRADKKRAWKVPTKPQPPNSPRLAPLDSFVFPRLKTPINGNHFGTVDNVKDACTRTLKDIAEEAYRNVFDAWKSRWKQGIDSGALYFETF